MAIRCWIVSSRARQMPSRLFSEDAQRDQQYLGRRQFGQGRGERFVEILGAAGRESAGMRDCGKQWVCARFQMARAHGTPKLAGVFWAAARQFAGCARTGGPRCRAAWVQASSASARLPPSAACLPLPLVEKSSVCKFGGEANATRKMSLASAAGALSRQW